MATYTPDLTTLTGFTERWNPTKVAAAVEAGVGLRFTVDSDSSNTLYGLSVDAVDIDGDRANFEILVKVRFSSQYDYSVARTFGVFGRGSGTDNTDEAAYTAMLIDAGGDSADSGYIDSWGSGSFSNALISLGATADLDANVWHWLKFKANGSNLYIKTWKDGSSEPSWTGSGTDSSISSAGYIGFCINVGTQIDPIDLGYLAIATGTDTLTTPGSFSSRARVQFIGL